MSRGLRTALRVAELRERRARTDLGAAAVTVAAASAAARARLVELSALRGPGPGGADDLRDAHDRGLRHAEALSAAQAEEEAAREARDAALAAWTAAATRRGQLEDHLARSRAAEEARAEAAQQRVLDDRYRPRRTDAEEPR